MLSSSLSSATVHFWFVEYGKRPAVAATHKHGVTPVVKPRNGGQWQHRKDEHEICEWKIVIYKITTKRYSALGAHIEGIGICRQAAFWAQHQQAIINC